MSEDMIRIDGHDIALGQKAQVLEEIHNLETMKKPLMASPLNALLIARINNPVIGTGDALFHLAY